jgi:hypothetical protein
MSPLITIQYNQFSRRARAASQVASRLNQVVSESSSGQGRHVAGQQPAGADK